METYQHIFANYPRLTYNSLIDLSLSIKNFLKEHPDAFISFSQDQSSLSSEPL